MGQKQLVVIGAANIDIAGFPFQTFIPRDSNPGKVRISFGGVGRNIAHNLALLKQPVELLTLFSRDPYGQLLMDDCKQLGIGLSASETSHAGGSSFYLFLADERGDMVGAVNDMELYNHLTPSHIQKHLQLLDSASLLVLDTNLPQETISYVCTRAAVPVFADPVSVTKSEKLKPCLGGFHTITPNLLEAQALSGMIVSTDKDLDVCAEILLKSVKQVFITLGERGVYYHNGRDHGIAPAVGGSIVNATGAGDALLAGVIAAFQLGLPIKEAACYGVCAARLCISSPETVCGEISPKKINQSMKEYFGYEL